MSFISDLASDGNDKNRFKLDQQRVAIVYNTDVTATDSLTLANYYISARGLNPSLLYGIDFGPNFGASPDNISGGIDTGGVGTFYTDIIIPFAQFCRDNDVHAVITSNQIPNRVTGTDSFLGGNYNASVVGLLSSCHYFTESGVNRMTASNRGHIMDKDEPFANTANKTFVENPDSFGLQERISRKIWYKDFVFDSNTNDLEYGTFQPAYIPNSYDPLLSTAPLRDGKVDRLAILPHGMLGLSLTSDVVASGWTNTLAECTRLIDDAIESENLGWLVNKKKLHHGQHSVRSGATQLNGHESAIPLEGMLEAGWPVKASVNNSGLSAALRQVLGPNGIYPTDWDIDTTLATVFTEYNVLDDSYTFSDMNAGSVFTEDSFATFGTSLNNTVDGTWKNSFNFLPGSYHMQSTSFPSNTLATALANGACSGVGGTIEPLAGNVGFISPTVIGLLAGKTFMESHYDFMQITLTTQSYAAGDPLYTPYKKILEANMAVIDSILMTAGQVLAGVVHGYQRSPLIGSSTPDTIQGINIESISTISDGSLQFVTELTSLSEDFFDTLIVTDITNSVPFVTLQFTDAVVSMEGGDRKWKWTGSNPFFVNTDQYQLDFIKDTTVVKGVVQSISKSTTNSILSSIARKV